MLAAGLAEMLVGDANPLVRFRGLEHVLEQLARLRVALGHGGRVPADETQAVDQRVARLFELAEPEEPRPGMPGDGGGRRAGQRELVLEASDLLAKAAPGGALVDFDDER